MTDSKYMKIQNWGKQRKFKRLLSHTNLLYLRSCFSESPQRLFKPFVYSIRKYVAYMVSKGNVQPPIWKVDSLIIVLQPFTYTNCICKLQLVIFYTFNSRPHKCTSTIMYIYACILKLF